MNRINSIDDKNLLPLIDFDAGLVNDVPIIISDEPEVKRIFLPGIFFLVIISRRQKKRQEFLRIQ